MLDQPIDEQSFAALYRASHKRAAIRQAVRAAGPGPPFLPPYSPALNPIEQVFAKPEHPLRKAGNASA